MQQQLLLLQMQQLVSHTIILIFHPTIASFNTYFIINRQTTQVLTFDYQQVDVWRTIEQLYTKLCTETLGTVRSKTLRLCIVYKAVYQYAK